MASKRAFAVGDRVVVRYAASSWSKDDPSGTFSASIQKSKARVLAVSDDVVLIEWEAPMMGCNSFLRHSCRRLVRKKRKPRRRVWVAVDERRGRDLKPLYAFYERPPAGEMNDWIEFIEVRPKRKERKL